MRVQRRKTVGRQNPKRATAVKRSEQLFSLERTHGRIKPLKVTELRKPFKMVINNSVKSRGDEFTEK
jgi:methyl coenzyme M reductase beta subunit